VSIEPTQIQASVLRALAAGRYPDSVPAATREALARRGWVTLNAAGHMTITDEGRRQAPELAESMALRAKRLTGLLTNQFPKMVLWEAASHDLPSPSELARDDEWRTEAQLVGDLTELRECLPERPKRTREVGDWSEWRFVHDAISDEATMLVSVRQFDALAADDLIALHDAIDAAFVLIGQRAEDDTRRERKEKLARGTDGDSRGKTDGEVAASRSALERVEASRTLADSERPRAWWDDTDDACENRVRVQHGGRSWRGSRETEASPHCPHRVCDHKDQRMTENSIVYIPASDRGLYELVTLDPETRRCWGVAPMVGREYRIFPTKRQADEDTSRADLGDVVAFDLLIEPADQ
jgi:hypothetical protein